VDNYTDGMTLEEQIGQALMVGFSGDSPSQEIIDLIQRCHVGEYYPVFAQCSRYRAVV